MCFAKAEDHSVQPAFSRSKFMHPEGVLSTRASFFKYFIDLPIWHQVGKVHTTRSNAQLSTSLFPLLPPVLNQRTSFLRGRGPTLSQHPRRHDRSPSETPLAVDPRDVAHSELDPIHRLINALQLILNLHHLSSAASFSHYEDLDSFVRASQDFP